MPPIIIFDPAPFFVEFFYVSLLVLLCVLIYVRTKEAYALTGHKGIQYFRNMFLFFGLTYVAQFITKIILLGLIVDNDFFPIHLVFPISFILVAFFSTLAMIHLIYIIYWKKIHYTHFLALSSGFAIIVSVFAFFSRSPFLIALIQLPLIVLILLGTLKMKKHSRVRLIYLLLSVFWLLDLLILHSRHLFPWEFKIPFQIISLLIFFYLWYRVKKWIK